MEGVAPPLVPDRFKTYIFRFFRELDLRRAASCTPVASHRACDVVSRADLNACEC